MVDAIEILTQADIDQGTVVLCDYVCHYHNRSVNMVQLVRKPHQRR